MAFSTEAALDAYVLANASDHPWDGMWHPSSISGCARKAVYQMRQVEESDPLTPVQRRNFFVGHVWHSKMQEAVASHPDVAAVYTEVRVLIDDLNTTGDGDQVVIFHDGSAELEEFKTIASYGFKNLKGPKEDHLDQVKPYMFGLRTFGGQDQYGNVLPPLGDRLSRVRFTYIGKERLDTKEYVVDWDPAWETELRERISYLDSYMADPVSLPPRLPMNGKKVHYMCDWNWGKCPFFTRCWESDPAEVAPDEDIW